MRKVISGFVLIAVVAAAGPAFGQIKAGTGKHGESCTYELCMSNCIAARGKLCPAFCEKALKERKQSGVCK